jgi:hypothetical protein
MFNWLHSTKSHKVKREEIAIISVILWSGEGNEKNKKPPK